LCSNIFEIEISGHRIATKKNVADHLLEGRKDVIRENNEVQFCPELKDLFFKKKPFGLVRPFYIFEMR